jgi:hypothetical protein
MADLLGWLDARRPEPPPSLRAALHQAVREGDPGTGTVARRLAAAALRALGQVVGLPSTRAHALRLLAADALFTYACEAALEAGAGDDPEAIDRLLSDLDPRRFGDLLQERRAP